MADIEGDPSQARNSSSSSTTNTPTTRQRAPTITIDTSAVQGSSEAMQDSAEHSSSTIANTTLSPPDDHRPTTSSNTVLSPISTSPGTFLSVPVSAPRRNSSESENISSWGGETAAGPPSATSDISHTGSTADLIHDPDALKPDPGTEDDFNVENNHFAFSPGQLSKLLNPKSLAAFFKLGGLAGLERGLRTDVKAGLNPDEAHLTGRITFEQATSVEHSTASDFPDNLSDAKSSDNETASRKDAFIDRKRVFRDNRLPEKPTKGIFLLMWMAWKDKVLILLSIAAIVSLAVGIYQSVQPQSGSDDTSGTLPLQPATGSAPVEWVEGVAIMVAIFVVIVVGALNDWQKERQFAKLNKKKDQRNIKVIRIGRIQEISVYDVLVGDVVYLEPGDIVPVDGIYIDGHGVKCDESSATGESDLLRKTPALEVYKALEAEQSMRKMDPFILSGAKITEGTGTFLVTATGVNSTHGKTMMSLRDEGEVTPLQSKLNVLAEQIAKLGGAAALLYFVVAFIEFLVRITRGSDRNLTGPAKGQLFLQIFVTAVSVVVVAVPEGLPLAVTLALAFATKKMTKDNNLVRLLRSCETMGNATTICSDKTGTLTQNRMSVVAGTLGTVTRFGDRQGLGNEGGDSTSRKAKTTANVNTDDISAKTWVDSLHNNIRLLLKDSIVLNTTAFEGEEDGKRAFIGSKTETALLDMAQSYLGLDKVSTERANAEVVQSIPFDSGRKCMGVVIKTKEGTYRMFVKGASEILLERCTRILEDPNGSFSTRELSSEANDTLRRIISAYARRSLRTIAFLYKDFEQWPPKGARRLEDDPSQILFDDLNSEMTFIGVVGIQDPLRPGVQEAVQDCKNAGVVVRMVTGDNIETAKAIATDCGIYFGEGLIMEGPEFRRLSKSEMLRRIPQLQVLARSSPEDKRILTKRLKELGETVAVTGDGTNDAPALKAADVGFSMGIAGTEVAKEASAIILMDDNFSSIVKALMWGRAVNDAVKKFLQFQITVNITAVIITFITGVSNATSVLTAVQLLWVNLIMDTMAALALATDPPTRSILNRRPDRKSAPLITTTMWKMIIGQAIYQLVVILVLYYKGSAILSYQSNSERRQLSTLIFNSFVWMQIFNAFNCRRLDNKFNIFEAIHKNFWFIGILAIMIGAQILIVFVGGAALSVTRLNGAQWAYSLVIGFLSVPIAVIIRLIPDEFMAFLIPNFLRRKAEPKLVIEDEENRYEMNPALAEIRDHLMWIKKFKGGRLNQLSYQIKHPLESGLLVRPSSQRTRSRSSTNMSVPKTPEEQRESTPRPSTSQLKPDPPSRTVSGEAVRRSPRRDRSRSNSAITGLAAAGVMVGSIGGWSPIDKTASAENRQGAS